MDWLLEIRDELEKKVFDSLAHLLNLEAGLLFFDTTSTYFVTEDEDKPVARDRNGNPLTSQDADSDDQGQRAPGGFRTWGKSKDHRDDLPQIVIGMAVTRDGIPVRACCWPGDTAGSALIRQVRDDMRDWRLSKVIWVADRGFTSAENRRYLRKGGGSYIIGEKLRSGSADAAAAGQIQRRRGEPQGQGGADRRGRAVRHLLQPRGRRARRRHQGTDDHPARRCHKDSDQLSPGKRAELRGVISTKPGLNRYLRVTPGGLLRIDAARAKAEQNLDGKYLLRTADPKLSAEDIALGYKQLLEVERGWRDMKQVIDLRPIWHWREDRIRAHVILCWLALLLARIAENACGGTWPELRRELGKIHVGTFTGPAGTFRQRTEITKRQAAILKALDISAPPRIYQLKPSVEA